MARRQSIFDDLMDVGAKIGWRAASLAAVIAFATLHLAVINTAAVPATGTVSSLGSSVQQAFYHQFALFGQYLLPVALLIGAAAGFVRQIRSSSLLSRVQENPSASITQLTWQAFERLVSTRAYDAVTGWLGSIQTGVGGGATLQNASILYDEMGNVTQRQDNNAGLTENFFYDNLYRLDHSTLGGATNLQMTYDALGDITARSDVAGGASWTYDPTRKHAVTQAGSSSFTYAYDANGNVSSRNGSLITWTSYNYPSGVTTSAESASFDYGADRQRWRMIYTGPAGTETTYYITPLFEAVYTSSGTDFRHYIQTPTGTVVQMSRTTGGAVNVRTLLADHQGSIASIVSDLTGTNFQQESFTAYGNRRESSTWTGSPTSAELMNMDRITREGYTFQSVLGTMGLNHLNGRVEDSITGRFLSPDSRGTSEGNTLSWNRYSYVLNNPLTLTDPTGHNPFKRCTDDCGSKKRRMTSDPGSLGPTSGYTSAISSGVQGSNSTGADLDALANNGYLSVTDGTGATTTVSDPSGGDDAAGAFAGGQSGPSSGGGGAPPPDNNASTAQSEGSAQSQDQGQSQTSQGQTSGDGLQEIVVTAQSTAQNGPLLAQLVDPVIDPILQTAIDTGRVPTIAEQLAGRPKLVPRIGVPPPLPQVAPPPPWWLQVLQWLGSAVDRIGGVSPAAPPVYVCPYPTCQA